jgi:hypothetical protein
VNSSALYPAAAQQSALYIDKTTAVPHADIAIANLDPAATYDLILFPSRDATDDRTTVYTVGGVAKSLQAAGNTANTVQYLGLRPAANGTIALTVAAGGASQYGYLNVLELVTHAPAQAMGASAFEATSAAPGDEGGSARCGMGSAVALVLGLLSTRRRRSERG